MILNVSWWLTWFVKGDRENGRRSCTRRREETRTITKTERAGGEAENEEGICNAGCIESTRVLDQSLQD